MLVAQTITSASRRRYVTCKRIADYPDLSATSTLGGNTSLIKTDLDSTEPRGDIAFDSSEVDAICHFFNISNSSSEDKMFLLIARRTALQKRLDFKWG